MTAMCAAIHLQNLQGTLLLLHRLLSSNLAEAEVHAAGAEAKREAAAPRLAHTVLASEAPQKMYVGDDEARYIEGLHICQQYAWLQEKCTDHNRTSC